MSIRLVLQQMSKLQLQPFVRAASHLSESQKAVDKLARLAFKQQEKGQLSISRSEDAIWTRIGFLEGTSKISLSRRPKEEIGASFLKIIIEDPDQTIFAEFFSAICRAVGDAKGTDYVTISTTKLSEAQKKFLVRSLGCIKLNPSEFLIPESNRKIIEAIWVKSSNS